MIIHLGGDPISVVHAEIGQTFHSEQNCIKRMRTIFKEATDSNNPIPREISSTLIPCLFLYKTTIMASPIADSAATTVRIKNTNICPVRSFK